MKKPLPIILILAILLFSACSSKRFAKRGFKFEQAGMYEMAADMYYQAVQVNPRNVDAVVGLRKNGQRVLDDKSMQVQIAYLSRNDRETVYSFIDAKQYLEKINATGVALSLSETSKSYFEETKTRYLESLVYEARLLLDEEKFRESENKFSEIKRIDPTYQGIDEHLKISRAEPIYRQGLELLSAGLYRKAYYNFNNILNNFGLYKDAKDLRDEALSKATLTISVGGIDNKTRYTNAHILTESSIVGSLSGTMNPFIKIIDTKNTEIFIDQQIRGVELGSEIQVGRMLAANAMLNGSVIRFEVSEGKLETETKRGYLKEVVIVKDKVTSEEKRETRYHKVSYTETKKVNLALVSFQYQLSSTETGAILVSDAFNINRSDNVHYAIFQGDVKRLVPGYWEHMDKDSPKDRIDDNPNAVGALQMLLKATQNIKSADLLKDDALGEIARRVTAKIEAYNPEN